MINFRFHIVSLIAVFLALSVGIVVGSTVIDKAIVHQLRANIHRVERNDDSLRAAVGDLRRERDGLQTFADQVGPILAQGRLTGTTVAMMAVRGVDSGAVKATVDLVRAAGARVPSVVWLEPSWALSDGDVTDKLSAALGTPPILTTAPTTTPTTARGATTTTPPAVEALRQQGLRVVANRLTTPLRRGTDPLTALEAGGFVSIDGAGIQVPEGPAWPAASRVVLLGGNDAGHLSSTLTVDGTNALLDAGANVVVGEIFKVVPKSQRGDIVNLVRHDQSLAARVATVDDVDVSEGRMALVLSIDEFARGVVGHYGVARTAKRQVPAVPSGTP